MKATLMTAYDIFEHRHRFSVWAAARAAQRGFTTVAHLRDALEQSGVVEFVAIETNAATDARTFDQVHREWCRSIIRYAPDGRNACRILARHRHSKKSSILGNIVQRERNQLL
ncbi:MAG TPA: hypothetical protein VGN17_16175 [Bryobacteraceae bacterium]